MATLLVGALQLDGDQGPVGGLPVDLEVPLDHRLVAKGIDDQFVAVGRFAPAGAALDDDRFAGGELAIHARGTDANALLASTLTQAVEFRPIQQLAKYLRDLGPDDAWTIVRHLDPVSILGQGLDRDFEIGQDSGLLTGIQRVVDRFLDRSQQRFARTVEAKEVSVLGEELTDRDVTLPRGHALRSSPSARRLVRALR